MKINGNGVLRAAVAAALICTPSYGVSSPGDVLTASGGSHASGVTSQADIARIRGAADELLLAIGRIDFVFPDESELIVLGNRFKVLGTQHDQSALATFEVGSEVALFGELTADGYFVSAGMLLGNQYVPGASYVYLRGTAGGHSVSSDRFYVGSQEIASGDLQSIVGYARPQDGDFVELIGTQPAIGGVVLASWQERGTSHKTDASVGTGKTDASVGTGKTDASVGTGKTDASVGTGKTDASVGTGKTDASVGTGKTDASVGTGKTDASVGTGKTDASVGTGKTDASVGTGKTDASVGTGKTDASVGTGKTDASVGTGRTG